MKFNVEKLMFSVLNSFAKIELLLLLPLLTLNIEDYSIIIILLFYLQDNCDVSETLVQLYSQYTLFSFVFKHHNTSSEYFYIQFENLCNMYFILYIYIYIILLVSRCAAYTIMFSWLKTRIIDFTSYAEQNVFRNNITSLILMC